MTKSEFVQSEDGTLRVRTTKRGHDVLDDPLLKPLNFFDIRLFCL